MLADFSFTPPETDLRGFEEKRVDGRHGRDGRRRRGVVAKMGGAGMKMGTARREDGDGGMKMGGSAAAAPAPDLNDVKYDAFLANLRTLADPDIVKVEPGGRVLVAHHQRFVDERLPHRTWRARRRTDRGRRFRDYADPRAQLPGRHRPTPRHSRFNPARLRRLSGACSARRRAQANRSRARRRQGDSRPCSRPGGRPLRRR